jgi:biotin carboxylase
VQTNRDFLLDLIADPDFIASDHHTRWVEQSFLPAWQVTAPFAEESP